MKFWKCVFSSLAILSSSLANAEITEINLTLKPLAAHLGLGDMLIVKYDLKHTPTRNGGYHSLYCKVVSGDDVVMGYNWKNQSLDAYLPLTFDFRSNKMPKINTTGEFRLILAKFGRNADVVCEMFA